MEPNPDSIESRDSLGLGSFIQDKMKDAILL